MKNNRWLTWLGVFSVISLCVGALLFFYGFTNREPIKPISMIRPALQKTNEVKEYKYDHIDSIAVNANAILFSVSKGDENKISIHNIDDEDIKLEHHNGAVRIDLHQKRKFVRQKVEITLKDASLKTLDVSIDAGKVKLSDLIMDEFIVQNKATSVDLDHVVINKQATLEANAGTYRLEDVISNQTSLSLNAGSFIFTGELKGLSNFDILAGNVNVTLVDGKENYGYHIENKTGSVRIDGEKVEGFENSINDHEDATNMITIETKAGRIKLNFKEKNQFL